jgi:hypothetical protein
MILTIAAQVAAVIWSLSNDKLESSLARNN